MPGDSRDEVIAQLGELVHDQEQRGASVAEGLNELVDSARQQVPGADYAGITLMHRTEGISTAAATHRYPELLDEIQQRGRNGPCVAAAFEHHMIHIEDLNADQRWPKYRQATLDQSPVRSVLSFELFVGDDITGALNFHAEQPNAFGEEAIELGFVVASHVALAWKLLRRNEQFRSALASRDIIGQAKGVVMERFDIDAVQAFALLAQLSKSSNTKLVDIARRLVEADHPSAGA